MIVFVVEAIAGLTPADQEAAELLRRAKAPVLVAVNKSDNAKRELEAAEFYALGWERTYPIAAIHGRGVADLLDEIVGVLPPESEAELARKQRETEAEAFSRDVEAGRLEAYVVGEDDELDDGAGDDGRPKRPTRPSTDAAATLGRADRQRVGRRAAGDRARRAARTSASRACSTRCSGRTG